MDEIDNNWYPGPLSLALFVMFILIIPIQIGVIYLNVDLSVYFRVHSVTPSPGWILSTLTHNHVWHLVMNSIGIILLGSAVERDFRTPYFILLFFAFGITTNVLAWIYNAQFSSPSAVAGASGAIYAFAGVYLVFATRHEYINFNDLPERRVRIFIHMLTTWEWFIWLVALATVISGISMAVLDIMGLIGDGSISHVGHGLGVILGVTIALLVKDGDMRFLNHT